MIASWTRPRKLPEPPSLPGLDEQLPVPIASSLHFIDDGKVLIVAYSDHGIVYGTLLALLFAPNGSFRQLLGPRFAGIKVAHHAEGMQHVGLHPNRCSPYIAHPSQVAAQPFLQTRRLLWYPICMMGWIGIRSLIVHSVVRCQSALQRM